MIEPPVVAPGQTTIWGPQRVRNEQRWGVRLPDGTAVVVAALLPELAREAAVRRRFVYEAERVAALDTAAIARVIAVGPEPDPRDVAAAPPWRARIDPPGQTLEQWLAARAPAPIAEALELIARVADTVQVVHEHGVVLRDLQPGSIALADESRVVFTDVGLSRLDILSSRTASSLMLEASPYAAPEHLRATVVDARADVFTVAALLWRAVTGSAPFGDQHALLRDSDNLPALRELRPELPADVSDMVARCLADQPDRRLDTARDVADLLRGGQLPGVALERVTCQACGAALRPAMRLCLECGKQAVQLHSASAGDRRYSLLLSRAKEDEAFLASLREVFETVGEGPAPALNFLIGDARMYSRAERKQRIQLPARLFENLSEDTARTLEERLRRAGVQTKLFDQTGALRRRRTGKIVQAASGVAMVGGVVAGIATASLALGLVPLFGGVVGLLTGAVMRGKAMPLRRPALAQLRTAPAALPAADPYVVRLAALLGESTAPDVAERVRELADLAQRLCDHRAAGGAADVAELIAEPLDRLVSLVEREVRALVEVDARLAELDEATLVRALAASEARGEPAPTRAPMLDGLDRLRALEDRRAAHLQRLLEAASLVRRTIQLGLDDRADTTERSADVAAALAGL